MHTAVIVALALLAVSVIAVIAVIVAIIAQNWAVRRAKPWLLRMLEIRGEVSVLEATYWVTKHHEEMHHMLISAALRELEREGHAVSRQQDGELLRRLYRRAGEGT